MPLSRPVVDQCHISNDDDDGGDDDDDSDNGSDDDGNDVNDYNDDSSDDANDDRDNDDDRLVGRRPGDVASCFASAEKVTRVIIILLQYCYCYFYEKVVLFLVKYFFDLLIKVEEM